MYQLQTVHHDQKQLFAIPALSLPPANPKHVLTSEDLSSTQIRLVLDVAKAMKFDRAFAPKQVIPRENRILAMIFEKQSLRTRFTFETAMVELGGHAIYLTKSDIDMGNRESIADVAENLSRWSAIIVARLNSHETLVKLAAHSKVPVINALTDFDHPCQGLADLLTVEQRFPNETVKIVYIGDGNNVANSLAVTAAKLGHNVVICTPPGYEATDTCYKYDGVTHVYDPVEAMLGADVVYTDVWVSMGQESEESERMQRFAKYQVNETLMSHAKQSAIFMHCLPARRGLEVSDGVIDGAQSVVFDQAENRLHAQKSLMKLLLDGALA
jgi:ornithine carbamoyltransferase